MEEVPDALIVAQKILSCVARVKEGFGVAYVSSVLRGENVAAIRDRGHDQLSTFGLLNANEKTEVRDWIYQLVGQGVLVQIGDPYPLLKLNPASWEVLKGQRKVRLLQIVRRTKGDRPAKSKADKASWEGVDTGLFDSLRTARKQLADNKKVPPYVIFSDATLRELARVRPSSLLKMRLIHGIGEAKLRDYGDEFLAIILKHCDQHAVDRDQDASEPAPRQPRTSSGKSTAQRDLACRLFRGGVGIEEVMEQTDRAEGTVVEYLCDFILEEKPEDVEAWIAPELYQRIAEKARTLGLARLKPIFVELEEKATYNQIRIVLTHLQSLE